MGNVKIKRYKKVLVANRGEIAIRVYRALNELGIQTVGIFSKEDKYALFRTKTDEAYMLNPEKGPLDAYLDIKNIIKIAKAHGPAKSPIVLETFKPDSAKADAHWLTASSHAPAQNIRNISSQNTGFRKS